MKFRSAIILAIWTILPLSTAFSILPSYHISTKTVLYAGSRLEGNRRDPSPEELEIMDEMISKLANAKPYELPNAVRRAFRVLSSPQIFMRIADLADQTDDEIEKEKLSALASNLSSTLEAVVETTEEQLDERAEQVEEVVKAAAEPDSGEFLVPLKPERIDAMRKKLEGLEEAYLDEAFLSTLDAWMNRCHQDGMDLMIQVLQKVLQMYAGKQVTRALDRQEALSNKVLRKLLETDADQWDAVLAQHTEDLETVRKETLSVMESLVLSLDAGSMAQRVQAEYLKELVTRVEAAQAK